MVKRKVRLSQIVCAVYALNKPSGVSKKEIIRFCKSAYGCTCRGKAFDLLLERGLDEGLLTSFHKRYRVTKLRCGILWAGDRAAVHRRRRARRERKNKGTKKERLRRKRNTSRKQKSHLKRKIVLEKDSGKEHLHLKQTLSLFFLWKKELRRQIERMKKSKGKISKRAKSICKKSKSRKSKSKIHKSKLRSASLKSKRTKNGSKKSVYSERRQKMKNTLKSRLKQKVKGHGRKDSKTVDKNNSHKESKESTNSGGPSNDRSEYHRSLLRQTKNAVVHGKSWDNLNFTRQRRVRENQKMVKNSQLVQKILTQKHAASWDDLNSKLKEMKEQSSCGRQEGRANGDGASRQVL